MEEIKLINTEKVLKEYGERVAAAYREKMRGHGHFTIDTDTLINRVEVVVESPIAGSVSVALRLAEYWKYVEWDTRPHYPPIAPLIEWAKAKQGIPQPSKQFPTPESFAYAVRHRIAQVGTKGTHDLADAVQQMNEQYLPMIEQAVSQDIDAATNAQISLLFGEWNK